ncbi:MAG: class I SAM-dependent methyltransferase [Sphingomonas bacterium]|nr:class I SAM-dependent methyltransferase [Sphingomonas bacterium]
MTERRFYEAPLGDDQRRSAPAALRNRDPITDVLREWLPPSGLVLEIASGTGEHAVHFARAFPALDWQPSDPDAGARASIAAWSNDAALAKLRPALDLDSGATEWPVDRAAAIVALNMVHISPWAAALGLLDGAARLLAPGAPLILYGPWIEAGVETAASNLAFDHSLRERDREWGLRAVEDFAAEAARRGLSLVERRAMPANNLMLLLRRSALGDAPGK